MTDGPPHLNLVGGGDDNEPPFTDDEFLAQVRSHEQHERVASVIAGLLGREEYRIPAGIRYGHLDKGPRTHAVYGVRLNLEVGVNATARFPELLSRIQPEAAELAVPYVIAFGAVFHGLIRARNRGSILRSALADRRSFKPDLWPVEYGPVESAIARALPYRAAARVVLRATRRKPFQASDYPLPRARRLPHLASLTNPLTEDDFSGLYPVLR